VPSGTPRTDEPIGLRDAAARLGVHYMTAYRYVRLGVLPAEKVGGEWRVRLDDLEQVAQRADPPPRGAGGIGWARYRSQLVTRLRAGDEAGAWALVERALGSGAEARDVHLELIGPALRSIGALWQQGEIDVAEEHRASAVAQRLIGRLGPSFARRGRKRGAVVIGAAPNDRHSLPTAILGDILRGEGLDVVDLGADTPAASFVDTVRSRDDVVAIAVSVGSDTTLEDAREVADAVHAALPDVAVFIGGPAVPDETTARRLGADEWGTTALDVARRCVDLAAARRR
jgi:MerR family transcriptional regulator, light-induced transcriptional regulator